MLPWQVVSNEDQNLTVTSEQSISVEGHEGLMFDGKMFQFNVEKDVEISSTLVSEHTYNIIMTQGLFCCFLGRDT